ncbi:hypothetical protein NQ314_008316 [Rhamnusium bicolor]|uniref:Methionine synthase reductase n=1 Tax=Rhamnusium bicolor TaxID=1586634 RepID=A0AAV8YCS9_9CUCU|nr:hypothetical protein NQ314_008316 [Rhamnusium bicolor]
MSDYFVVTFLDNSQQTNKVMEFDFRNKPFSISDVFLAPIEDFELLTKGQDVKRVYDLKLSLNEISFDFLPGDTIGILPRNDSVEVTKLLIRLNIESQAEETYTLKILSDSTKKNPKLPRHVPNCVVIKDIFTYYIDIRKPPKKLFLKALIRFTEDPQEVNQLEEICSPKGSKQYSELINGTAQTLLGLLNTFPSCYPPIEIILEHSMPLQPRYFSISSSPMMMELKGVCTGWLEELIKKSYAKLEKIPFYFRKPNTFRIPSDLSTPIIMVATGTGLAPFKSFLDHRLFSKENGDCNLGEAFLFYGCRYSGRDYLYSKEIEEYLHKGALTKLYTAFSREIGKCYVQDKINENGEEFVNNILKKRCVIYVCGNAKSMVKDVKNAVTNNLTKYGHLELLVAEEYLDRLCKENRFIVDSWT